MSANTHSCDSNFLIDTHCHLHDREFFSPAQADEVLDRAHKKGVAKIICIGTDHADSLAARDFSIQHENTYWTYGIHPEHAKAADRMLAIAICKTIANTMPIAIGEIGLDYHYDGYDRAAQIRLFEQMLQLARDLDLPVSLHIREAFDDALSVLDNFPKTRGVVHSFTGSKKDLKKLLARNFYIGVNGLATYTTPALPPLEKMVLETDAPFLTPVPFRGTINEPGCVPLIADYLSGKLGVDLAEIREQTTQNARKIFQI